MLERLHGLLGRHTLCAVLGLPVRTIESWRSGRRVPDGAGIRVIWLTWCLLLHPERLQTVFDVATWGRFRISRAAHPVVRTAENSFLSVAVPDYEI